MVADGWSGTLSDIQESEEAEEDEDVGDGGP